MSSENISVHQVLHSTIEPSQIITKRLVLDLYNFIQDKKILGAEACKFLNYHESETKKFTTACFKLNAKRKGKRGKYLDDFLNQEFKLNFGRNSSTLTKFNQDLK